MINPIFNVDVERLTIFWINNDCFDEEGSL